MIRNLIKLGLVSIFLLTGCKTENNNAVKKEDKDSTVVITKPDVVDSTLNEDTGKEEIPEVQEKEIEDPGKDRQTFADFELQDINGKTHRISDYRGKVVIVDFWATWCPPCRKEIPHLISFYNKYNKKGLVIVGVSLDKRDKTLAMARDFGINYVCLVDETGRTGNMFGVRAIPTTFFLDKKGRIAKVQKGFTEAWTDDMENMIRQLINENY